MSSLEALAVTALRRWCAERAELRAGRTVQYNRHGWTARTSRALDARFIRVLGFEEAFATIPNREQTALLLTYRDGLNLRPLSAALKVSVSTAAVCLLTARRRLANTLDRRELI